VSIDLNALESTLRADSITCMATKDYVIAQFDDMITYRNIEGDPRLMVIIDPSDDRLKIIAPMAWRLDDDETRSVVYETCLSLQHFYFGIRFEFDRRDGELRPTFDFFGKALPDVTAVPGLVRRFVSLFKDVARVIDEAIRTGTVPDPKEVERRWTGREEAILSKLAELNPEQLDALFDAIIPEEAA
jgi:hypothetical protein